MTVLVLARDLDPTTDAVVGALGRRGVPVFRTDLAAFPQELTLTARHGACGWDGTLRTAHRRVRLSEIRSVWYRRPSRFISVPGMSSTERRHADAEARAGVGGVLSCLDTLWVNHPARHSDASKPAQLQMARRCGLAVPESLVTNSATAVREFAADLAGQADGAGGGALAGKTLAASLRVESGRPQMAYTRRIPPAELDDLAGVDTTAHLFQPFLDNKAFESRVTVVGDRIFAAAIHADSPAARIDYRADYDHLRYTLVEPPAPVRDGMLAFLRAFGLVFGAFDFAITQSGEWVMFECNPAGAYRWIEHALGLPITDTLAELLAAGRPPR